MYIYVYHSILYIRDYIIVYNIYNIIIKICIMIIYIYIYIYYDSYICHVYVNVYIYIYVLYTVYTVPTWFVKMFEQVGLVRGTKGVRTI